MKIKITIESKNCRLKITAISKNLWSKNSGCRISPALSQNRNAGDTTGKMECDRICPQIQNTYRGRRHLLKCKSQNCLKRNNRFGNLCRL